LSSGTDAGRELMVHPSQCKLTLRTVVKMEAVVVVAVVSVVVVVVADAVTA